MKWVVRVWSHPADPEGFRLLCEPPILDATVTERDDANGSGVIKIPADYEHLHLIRYSEPGAPDKSRDSLIAFHRVEDGKILPIPDVEFWAEEGTTDLVDSEPAVAISGELVRAGLDDGIIYPRTEGADRDWIWGGRNLLGPLNITDLGTALATYELYLSGERYLLEIFATDGTFKLVFDGNETDDIDHEPTAQAIKSALEDLDGITEVDVVEHEDGTFTIDCRNPKDLPSDITIDDSDLDGSANLTKEADGFDTSTNPEFTLEVVARDITDETEGLPWNASANAVEGVSETLTPPGSGLQGLANVDDVAVTGTGVFSDPYTIVFHNPPDPDAVNVSFPAGQAVLRRTQRGGVDPEPTITISKPIDAGAGPEETHGKYQQPPLQIVTEDEYQDEDTDWVLRVNAAGRFAGSQRLINVEPGRFYSKISVRVRPEVTGKYTLVIRDTAENLITQTTPRDNLLQAGVYTALTIENVTIPVDVEEVVVRVAVTDERSSTWVPHFVNWQHAIFQEGLAPTTIGEIDRLLVESIQARGAIPWVQLGFTDEEDSNEDAWDTDELSWRADVGEHFAKHQLVAQREVGYESRLVRLPGPYTPGNPTHELLLFNPGGMGQTATTQVVVGAFDSGRLSSRRIQFTHLLVEDDTGATVEVTDEAFDGLARRERFLRAEYAPDLATAEKLGQQKIAEQLADLLSTQVRLSGDTVVPYRDFGILWTVPYSVGRVARHDRRIHAITLRLKGDEWEAEVTASRMFPSTDEGGASVFEAIRRLYAQFGRRRRPVVIGGRRQVTSGAVGAHIHLERFSGQSITQNTDTLVLWDTPGDFAPRNFAQPSLPAGAIVIQEPGYYDFHIDLGLSPQATNPMVWVTREQGGQEVQVWPSVSDPGIWSAPYPASWFSNVVPAIPCLSGDVIRVYVRHSSGQAVDMTGAFVAKLVDRAGRSRLETPEVIEHVTAGTGVSTTMNITMSEPPEPGDVLVLVLVLMSRTLTGVSGDGWQTHGAFSERYVMSKVAGSDESDTVTITTANSGLIRYTHGALIRLRSSTSPVDVAANSGSSGEGHTAPSVDGVPGGLMLACWACQTSGLSVPDGLTELVAEHTPGGSTIAVGYRDTVGGATGDYLARLVDHSSSHATLGVQLAFGPRSN